MANSKHRSFFMCATIWIFTSLWTSAQTVLISELMANNNSTLQDTDGNSPDWIELYNNTDATLDLTGWHLTDDTNNLAQWTFPAAQIAPRGFLVVFASEKDRAVAGEELHTNFKLSAKGGYVGLIRPDGTTLESDIAFPSLQEDASYGYASVEEIHKILLDTGASCSAHIPTAATDATGWRESTFDNSGWMHGVTGVGFDTNPTYTPLIGLDVIAMKGINASVYIHVPFICTDPSAVKFLTLKMKYDDGFVAYLNGTPVQTVNFEGTPAWDSRASAYHNDSLATQFEAFDLSNHISTLLEGTNTLSIHGLNSYKTNSDLLFVPRIEVENLAQTTSTNPGFLGNPTPGMPNPISRYDGLLETAVSASPKHGFYEEPIPVELFHNEIETTIHYTLDGSSPSTNSPLYTSAIPLSATTVLRASAFCEGWKPSPIHTESYLFLDDVIHQPQASSTSATGQILHFGMDPEVVGTPYADRFNNPVTVKDALRSIPTLSIVTDPENLFDSDRGIYVNAKARWERPASFELICPNGSEGFNINAGLRIRGGYSRHSTNPKHAFRLFFRSEYGEAKLRYPLFEDEGVDEFDKIDLRTSQNYNWAWRKSSENTFLRDLFVRDTSRDMNQPYTRSRYYHLYLNGQYWGLYMTEERPEARYAASYFGGSPEDYDTVKAVGRSDPIGEPYTIKATDGTLDAYHRLFVASTNGFAETSAYFAVQGLDPNGQPDPLQEKLLNIENLIDYLLLIHHAGASDNSLSKFLRDSKVNNFFATYNRVDPDGFTWFQHDSEHAYDTSTDLDRTGPFPHENLKLFKYFNAQNLHDKLTANAEYRIAFADRVYLNYFSDGALAPSNCAVRLDARTEQIDRAIIANSARWGSTSMDRPAWTNAVATTRAFLVHSNRCEQVVEYLRADGLIPSIEPPVLNDRGGVVNPRTPIRLSSSEGTIYYSTDGSDPRAIGGEAVGSIYSAPIIIQNPVVVRARVRKADGEWSALTEAVFWLPEVPLAITELMYHAASNALDFIEIRNIAPHPVSLANYSIDGAVRFGFGQRVLAPGEHAIVVKDSAIFSIAYPAATRAILGEYNGDLDNSGEKIKLEFYHKDLIEFTYSDARNWPQAADGGGHSLVPLDFAMTDQEHASLDYGENWRASTYIGGSPGTSDPKPITKVLINEVIAHTDTGQPWPNDSNDQIELYNRSASPVDLSGWSLDDGFDGNNPWLIPNGTTIAPHGFLLFDENDFHPDRIAGFGLDKAGERVVLRAPDRIADTLRFKGQENGVSLGRYPDGTINWTTTRPTPGSANQPQTLPVTISALMYHPAGNNEMLEYIQLQNTGTHPVQFETGAGTWRIDGEVAFAFPPSTSLLPSEKLWIVPFNPVSDTALLALFSSTYGLNPAEETILGPYHSHLSNRGGRVALEGLQESDDPLDPLSVSWVVIDEFWYFDRAPWPKEADGTGQFLLRTGPFSWGVPSASDTDADGLPDEWETGFGVNHPNEDSDGDGQSNRDEYVAGTDPSNPNSQFTVHRNGTALSWATANGRRYDVLWTPDLSRGFQLLDAALPASESNYVDTAHSETPSGFYKIVARLPDSTDRDGDGLPDAWETQYFADAAPMDDPDGDGIFNRNEYLAGTNPSDPTDALRVSQSQLGDKMLLQWTPSVYGRTYTILHTPSLSEPFRIVGKNIAYPRNSFTNAVPGFYKVEVRFANPSSSPFP